VGKEEGEEAGTEGGIEGRNGSGIEEVLVGGK
jgi:hypothetical protein